MGARHWRSVRTTCTQRTWLLGHRLEQHHARAAHDWPVTAGGRRALSARDRIPTKHSLVEADGGDDGRAQSVSKEFQLLVWIGASQFGSEGRR